MSKTPARPENGIGVKVSGSDGNQSVTLDDAHSLNAIFGTDIAPLADALLGHCIKVLKASEASDEYPANDERNFMLAAVAELKPRDTVERLLAVQMAATHVALIRSARWLAHAERVEQVNAHYSGYNKLARTYAAQVEALRKHRNGGKQTVTVQHVNVSEGGQAIVGHVEAGGRAEGGK